jgi:transposase-like protein
LWIALDSETKAVLSYWGGKRNGDSADQLIRDLRQRATSRFQLTTDGFESHPNAFPLHFGEHIDYTQCVTIYAKPDTSGPDCGVPRRSSV